MKLFDFSLKLNGFKINEAKDALKAIQSIRETEYDNYLATKREEIVNYHLANNSFYKSFAKNANPQDWESLPVMYKSDLQYPLEKLLSSKFTKSRVYIDKTSGASGQPFIFAKDKFCHALTWSVIIDRFSWLNINFNHSKQARFYGIPKDIRGFYKEKIKDFLGNRKRFNVFDLSDRAFEDWIQVFKSTQFEYINGYTSPIVLFAKYLMTKKIKLNTICPTLRVCVVTSEILFDTDRLLMETQFGVPVINEYGASELDLIAFENSKKEWIINNETLFVEVLDENDNPLPYGEEGRLVITSLYNKAQAFIRYDIGDIGIISKESTPKKMLLKKLIGRTNDTVILPSGKKAAGLTFYYITKSIIESDNLVKEFVIEQQKKDTFKIIYESEKMLSKEKEAFVKSEMTGYLEKGLHILFEKQDKIHRSKSGKLKQFTSLIN
ncbi:MAG: phenylacetate--CoA ligase family protein [Flavobacteriaceae bacterium]|nr:phenylacetate--CoA ligase family protein [Flavobacteriaceae bacterium]